ncbi:MAG: hypothetical protein AB1716_15960 [Planctomycetota bacterium]
MPREPLEVEIGELEAGWATVSITAGPQGMHFRWGYQCCDSLGDFVRGLAALNAKPAKVEVQLSAEGREGGYLVSLRRDGDALEVIVKRLVSDWDDEQVARGRQARARLRWRGPFREGARAFVAAFDRLIAEVGVPGYERGWWRGLPAEELRRLRKALG